MSLDPDIARKLDALTAERSFTNDGAMILGQSGHESAFAAILNAIDLTVLPRKLTFVVDAASITISVAGRRLRSVDASIGDIPDLSSVFGQLLTPSDDAEIELLGRAFAALTDRSGTLTQRSATAGAGVSGAAEGGISVTRLAAVWSIDLDSKPPSPMERFCLQMGQDLRAMIVIKEGAVQTGLGDPDVQASLRRLWDGSVDAFDPAYPAFPNVQTENVAICQQGLIEDADSVCFLKINEISVLAAISGAAIGQIAKCWQEIKP